jgi:hypothetical protein
LGLIHHSDAGSTEGASPAGGVQSEIGVSADTAWVSLSKDEEV